jgi:hypothetical protein
MNPTIGASGYRFSAAADHSVGSVQPQQTWPQEKDGAKHDKL